MFAETMRQSRFAVKQIFSLAVGKPVDNRSAKVLKELTIFLFCKFDSQPM